MFLASLAVCAVTLLGAMPSGAGERIVVLLSAGDEPFAEAYRGAWEYLRSQGVAAEFEEHQLDGDPAAAVAAIDRIRSLRPALVMTFGSLATESALEGIAEVPVVACMVIRLDTVRASRNATGVGLEFPFDVQLDALRSVLPFVRSLGVLYNPSENGQRLELFRRSAAAAGLEVIAREVRTPQDVPAALTALARSADVLFGIADRVATAPQMAKPLLLFSFRQNIPFVGLSSAWVKAGALYALDWDFADLGAQAGAMAHQVLQGTPPSQIAAASPRTVRYSLNLRTARQLRISIPDPVQGGAWRTF